MPLSSASMKSVVLLLALAIVPLYAQETPEVPRVPMLSISGEVAWGSAIHGRAVGFALNAPHHHVNIAVRLGNGGGYATGTVYLMRAIGPGTSADDEIARTSVDLPFPFVGWMTLFEDLELDAGEYWIVVTRPREKAFSSINWIMASPMILERAEGVHYLGTTSYQYLSDTAEYTPASKFGDVNERGAFQIEVTEEAEEPRD